DGRALATGGYDTSVLTWDWMPFCGLRGVPAKKLDARRVAGVWDDLASADARKGYAAVGKLAACPGQAVPLLAGRVRGVSDAECSAVRHRLAELDSEDFAVREKAAGELGKLPAESVPLFYEALRGNPSPEVQRRIKKLLEHPRKARWSPDMLRRLRAVQAL